MIKRQFWNSLLPQNRLFLRYLFLCFVFLSSAVSVYANELSKESGDRLIKAFKQQNKDIEADRVFMEIVEFFGPNHLDVADALAARGFGCIKSKQPVRDGQFEISCRFIKCKNFHRVDWKIIIGQILIRDESKIVSGSIDHQSWFCPQGKKKNDIQHQHVTKGNLHWEVYRKNESN